MAYTRNNPTPVTAPGDFRQQNVSWGELYQNNWLPNLHAPTTREGNRTLMTWGPIVFEVYPLNFHEMVHETASEWVKKEVVGAANYREWIGEGDEIRTLTGRLFPYRLGGMVEIELLDAYRRGGMPNLIMGGDGRNLGWFVCERLSRQHTYLSTEGVGRQIQFEASFARVPVPDPADYLPDMLRLQQQP